MVEFVRKSYRASCELTRLAWRHPFSRASSWFSTLVIAEVAGVLGVLASTVGMVVTHATLDYFVIAISSAALAVIAAAGATAVVGHGLHLERPEDRSG